MISEKDKQAILNGVYGITREGKKVKYVGKRDTSDCDVDFPLFFVVFNQKDEICRTLLLSRDFTNLKGLSGDNDVVGLWEDKPEPFDLERALDGELVKYSDKPCYVYQSKVTGLFWVEAQDGSFVDNDTSLEAVSEQGMWKEPEPVSNTVTVTLPRALKEPQDEMWFVDTLGYKKSGYGKYISTEAFNRRVYFASEEDAKAWFDAMQDSRP